MFLQQMLKPMSVKEDGSDKDEGDDSVGDNSTYQGMGVEAMARGGFGGGWAGDCEACGGVGGAGMEPEA